MCGIAGIFHTDGRPVDLGEIVPITRALSHRGPDGEGIVLDGAIGFGHRRLSIIDPTDGGRQPMRCIDDRYLIVYNGEIFNFLEVRRELERLGHRFRSESDTEVLVHAFHQWGPDCVLHLNGMWAFAIWDRDERELFLSRDHFGIKPLMFLERDHRFVFASELKSFLHLPGFTARENEALVYQTLAARASAIADNDTLIQGVVQIPAGHNMIVRSDGHTMWRWWNTLHHIPEVPKRFEDQVEQFRELFVDACRLRLRSDVAIGTCLSGGVDSSAVLCTLAEIERGRDAGRAISSNERVATDWQRAFVATFPGTKWDERTYAEVAIRHTGAKARMLPVTGELVQADLRQFAYDFETIGRALVAPIWCIYRHLRNDGVVVSLDGQGADELLAGYTDQVMTAEGGHSFLRSPLRSADLFRTRYGMYGRRIPALVAARSVLQRTKRRVRAGNTQVGSEAGSAPLIAEWSGEQFQLPAIDNEALASSSAFERKLYSQFHYDKLPNLLRFYDRLSMAHGVESRMPFMDWRVVTFAFGLPEEAKVGDGFTKRILREAMRGTMPESLRTRKLKTGFTSPMPNWFNDGLDRWILREIDTPTFRDHPAWNASAVREFVSGRCGNRSWTLQDCERVWPIVQAHMWRTSFFDDRPALAQTLPEYRTYMEVANG